MPTDHPDKPWTEEDLAARYGVNVKTLARLVATDPTFPQPFAIGKRLKLYHPPAVRKWERESAIAARYLALSRGHSGTQTDTEGQSGTTAPRGNIGPSRRRNRG